MRKRYLVTVLIFGVMAFAVAQQAQPGGQPPGGGFRNNPAMQAKMKKYQPWFDLTSTISLMGDVDKEKSLAFTKVQAKLALPILKDLATRAVLTPADAAKITTTLEDKVVTDVQLKWMDETQLKRDEERRKRQAAAQGANASSNSVRLPGLGGTGNRPPGAGAPGGQSGMFDAIMNDKPFNPFKTGRSADALKALTNALSKR
jgi:hypothetical protein